MHKPQVYSTDVTQYDTDADSELLGFSRLWSEQWWVKMITIKISDRVTLTAQYMMMHLAENKYQLWILIPYRSVGAVIGGLFIKEIRSKV